MLSALRVTGPEGHIGGQDGNWQVAGSRERREPSRHVTTSDGQTLMEGGSVLVGGLVGGLVVGGLILGVGGSTDAVGVTSTRVWTVDVPVERLMSEKLILIAMSRAGLQKYFV